MSIPEKEIATKLVKAAKKRRSLISSVRSIRRWLGKEGNRDVVRLFVDVLAFVVAVGALGTGAFVLKSYWRANELTQEAIRLNQEGISLNGKGLDELKESNKTNRKAIDLSEQSLELTRKSVELTRQSVELTRNSVAASQEALKIAQSANDISKRNADLTAQMVSSAQDELKFAQKGYELSNRNLVISNTPWVGVQIQGMNLVQKFGTEALEIDYTVTNHSDHPAPDLLVKCQLASADPRARIWDISGTLGQQLVMMPREKIELTNMVFPLSGYTARAIKVGVERGASNIVVLVAYSDTLGNKTNFEYSFRFENGAFKIMWLHLNVPPEEIDSLAPYPQRK